MHGFLENAGRHPGRARARTPLLTVLRTGGELLASNPDTELTYSVAGKALEFTARGIGGQTFVSMLQGEQSPVNPHAYAINNPTAAWKYSDCPAAENGFGELMRQLKNPDIEVPTCQLIVGEDEQPVMLRKSGIATTLTLKPVSIKGRNYPVGSLMSMRLRGEVSPTAPMKEDEINVHSMNEVSGLHFIRLTPWAYPRMLRRFLFKQAFARVETIGAERRMLEPATNVATYPRVLQAVKAA